MAAISFTNNNDKLDSYNGVHLKYNDGCVYLCLNKNVYAVSLEDAKQLAYDLGELVN